MCTLKLNDAFFACFFLFLDFDKKYSKCELRNEFIKALDSQTVPTSGTDQDLFPSLAHLCGF